MSGKYIGTKGIRKSKGVRESEGILDRKGIGVFTDTSQIIFEYKLRIASNSCILGNLQKIYINNSSLEVSMSKIPHTSLVYIHTSANASYPNAK